MPQDRDVTKLHPRLQEVIKKVKAQFPNILIYECLRSTQYQDELYAQGRTKPGNKVTNAKGKDYSSQHQWGIAFDFGYNEKGNLYPPSFMKEVGTFVKSLGCGWGGDWKMVDKPHVYLPDWGTTTSDLKKKYNTPEKFFATWNGAKTTTPAIPSSTPTTTYSKKQFITDVQKALGGLTVDGIAGPKTLAATITLAKTQNKRHTVIKPIQKYLISLGYSCGSSGADGSFGVGTESAIKNYQSQWTSKPDGIITAKGTTWKKLLGLS